MLATWIQAGQWTPFWMGFPPLHCAKPNFVGFVHWSTLEGRKENRCPGWKALTGQFSQPLSLFLQCCPAPGSPSLQHWRPFPLQKSPVSLYPSSFAVKGLVFSLCSVCFFPSLTPLWRDRRSWVSHTASVFDQHGPCIVVKRPSCCKLKRGIFPHSGGSAWDADGRACGLLPCKWVWFWGMARVSPEQRHLAGLVFSQENKQWVSSSWEFQSGGLCSRRKAGSGTPAAGEGRVCEAGGKQLRINCFAPALCCGPSLRVTKACLSLSSTA